MKINFKKLFKEIWKLRPAKDKPEKVDMVYKIYMGMGWADTVAELRDIGVDFEELSEEAFHIALEHLYHYETVDVIDYDGEEYNKHNLLHHFIATNEYKDKLLELEPVKSDMNYF